jgi:uncharacterized protein YbjT (DUF2867 family)
MRLVVTGITGTAGAAVLRQAVADHRVDEVLALGRRPPAVTNRKLVFVEHHKFGDLSDVRGRLRGLDAAIWCLGTSQNRVAREELHRITVDWVVEGARTLQAASPGSAFVHLSGAGADPSGRARMAFAQEKGQAEKALDGLGLERLWHVRPGYIHPPAPVEKPLLQDRLMYPLGPLMRRLAPGQMIDSDDLGKALVEVGIHGHAKRVLSGRDLRALVKSL